MSSQIKRPLWFIIAKVLFLQTYFHYVAFYGSQGYVVPVLVVSSLLMVGNYFLVRDMINFRNYSLLCLGFFVCGLLTDSIFIYFDFIHLETSFPPLWLPTLWLMFFAYYGDVFNKMLDFPFWVLNILGALGGTLAYRRAFSIGQVSVEPDVYFFIAVFWALFIPASIRVFKRLKLTSV